MKLNKKFRTFVFSNILLGAMAFNNLADDDFRNIGYKDVMNMRYKDGISNVIYSFRNYGLRIDYWLNGKRESLKNPNFSKMQNLFKGDNGLENFFLAVGVRNIGKVIRCRFQSFMNWVNSFGDDGEFALSILSIGDDSGMNVARYLVCKSSAKFMDFLKQGISDKRKVIDILKMPMNGENLIAHDLASDITAGAFVKFLADMQFDESELEEILSLKYNENGKSVAKKLMCCNPSVFVVAIRKHKCIVEKIGEVSDREKAK